MLQAAYSFPGTHLKKAGDDQKGYQTEVSAVIQFHLTEDYWQHCLHVHVFHIQVHVISIFFYPCSWVKFSLLLSDKFIQLL